MEADAEQVNFGEIENLLDAAGKIQDVKVREGVLAGIRGLESRVLLSVRSEWESRILGARSVSDVIGLLSGLAEVRGFGLSKSEAVKAAVRELGELGLAREEELVEQVIEELKGLSFPVVVSRAWKRMLSK